MSYKDFGQGIFATMLLVGAAVTFLVYGGSVSEPQAISPVPSAISADIRQQASQHLQRTSVDQSARQASAEQPSWVF